jgi:ATP adenylyltransferase
MEHLYAPWRSSYLLSKRKDKKCIFCSKFKEKRDKKNFILLRGENCFALLNLYPYNDGHLMIAPNRHLADPDKLRDEEWSELQEMSRLSLRVLKEVFHPEGFNVGMNLGKAAGAGIAEHLHLHVVPRWTGDTNFLPVIGKSKVISQNLSEVYRKLVPLFKAERVFLLEKDKST